MRLRLRRIGALVAISLAPGLTVHGDSFAQALADAATEFEAKLQTAGTELQAARKSVAADKVPLLQQLREAEDRLLAAEAAIGRSERQHDEFAAERRRLVQEIDAQRKTLAYASGLARDGLRGLEGALAPGEQRVYQKSFAESLRQLESNDNAAAITEAIATMYAHVEQSLGGYTVAGPAILSDDHTVVDGTYAFVGPEAFFQGPSAGQSGTLRLRGTSGWPTVYPLENWDEDAAREFFAGRAGTFLADASAGKALRLQETRGGLSEHIRKGGVVAMAIVIVGGLAVLLIVQKLRDVAGFHVESSTGTRPVLELVSAGAMKEAEAGLGKLRPRTRNLFREGLRHAHEPRQILEDRLNVHVLGERLHVERWMPLLAVIATAAPLMGLLGTVVGMVKTFALITVFGTGNAGRLSSGISEVLVATELGLAVAIPALVIHGLLSHTAQKKLGMLERNGLEFVTAVDLARQGNASPRVRHVIAP